jgi:guanylate kinase
MQQKGVLLIVCGPSGVGKTSLCRQLLEEHDRLRFSVSVTTREPRDGEVDGEDYHFVDPETFDRMKEEGAFAEWAHVHGNQYGTTFETLRTAWAEDHDLIFDIDYQGARQLKESFPDATSVLVIPPSMPVLRDRLSGRGSEDEGDIERRMNNARQELAQYEIFDFIVENDELDEAAATMQCIYRTARHRRRFQAHRVESLLDES